MTTVILVGLIVVLLAAAAYVGILLVRRSRSTPDEAEPGTVPGTERPRTVADLLRRRAAPVDELRPTTRPTHCPARNSSFPRFRGRTGWPCRPSPTPRRPSRRPLQRRPGSRPPRWMASRSATPPGAAPRG